MRTHTCEWTEHLKSGYHLEEVKSSMTHLNIDRLTQGIHSGKIGLSNHQKKQNAYFPDYIKFLSENGGKIYNSKLILSPVMVVSEIIGHI